ncbi:hypothetical protein KZZ52_58870 [Dactylosporangium sp. AC04546]|uniref:hypothetical protein n=1 Tax=Dactylosporangium sp. AC04546 TaxID=2862460 RepID=UPI001EDDCB06|nr:hypothetical protein [Dactylosporangium sp. AC04546]WVK83656.1 hypothetical protein KZZ52_58870 [Dactylosporangium sp. AC04546]
MSEYGEIETAQESGELEELHTTAGSEQDYQSDFGVYAQDTASAENTSFEQGHHMAYEDPSGARYEETDYVSYDHSAVETDSVFAAEGSESASSSEFATMDALRAQFEQAFAQGTVASN